MNHLIVLRRLAQQQEYHALRDACIAGSGEPAEQVLLALALAQLGDALAASDQLASLDPAALDLDARVDLAAACLALSRLDEAAALLEAALPEAGEHGLLLARLASCRMGQGRSGEALALYRRSASAESSVPVLLNVAQLALDAGALDEAQASLDRAGALLEATLDQWPASRQAYFHQQLLGLRLDIWLAAGSYAEAEDWLEARCGVLAEADWCGLLLGYAQRLAARDRHAQAEEMLHNGLRHYPQHAALYVQLADLALVLGRQRQAAPLLRRAIACAERQGGDTVVLWARLSSACLQFDGPAARQAAEKALALVTAACGHGAHPAALLAQWRASALLALAQLDAHEQRYTEAEAQYRAALDMQPDSASALQGLGQLYLQLGRIDEAVALFEQVRSFEPGHGVALLINARRFPEDQDSLDALEQLARKPALEGSLRSNLLFQLAAALEKRKDYARAFAVAEEANMASHKFLNYDPAEHRQRCARIRHAFSADLYRQRRDCGADSTVPVFVLGMPRSGTTLVEQIIAGHSQIHGAGELGVIPSVIAGLERWERHTGSGRGYPDCVDDLTPQAVQGFADKVLAELRTHAPQARHVVDKLPHNFENIGLIKFLFPQAKIISVRRDPRDIAVSNYFIDFAARHGGMGFAYDLGWIGEQLADHNILMQHWHQLFPGEILEVQYEDVVADNEGQARRMLDYIGVDWEPQVLNHAELERPVKTASVWQVRQPIYTTSKARWERYREHLAPLIRGTNAKITWQPITDMVSLPVPGLLEQGVACYREKRLDDAEYRFQRLLHHLPEHAAANFMLGLVYVQKGHLRDGIALMEKGHARCPWNRNWRHDLAQAWDLAGEPDKAAALRARRSVADAAGQPESTGEFVS